MWGSTPYISTAEHKNDIRTMEAHWILLGLLSFCSFSSCQECNEQLLENTDFPGTDIATLYSPDVRHCQLLCTQHPSCLFFTFIRPDWIRDDRHFYCYLKSTPSGKPKTQSPLLGVTSGYSLKSCTQPQQSCLSQVYQNIDFPGADYKFLFTADYQECQRACTHDPGCQFFTFANELFSADNIRYKCHLKFSWIAPVIPRIETKGGVVSGFSHNSFMKSPCSIFQSTDIPGKNIQMLLAASVEHCQYLCSAHPTCTYFSYVSESFKCYLKKDENYMVSVAKNGVTSGLPTRFCQPENSWVKVAHERVDFQGSDIRYELMDDPDTCQRTCTDNPNCQFYTYVYETFFDVTHRRRCYLKRVISLPAPPKVTKLSNVVSGFAQRNCVV
uniref:Coagulation factor XI-like n=1 Tax=Gouania willdenowi TaxID=441366 RepID=A0A8C5EIY0_GOUWI